MAENALDRFDDDAKPEVQLPGPDSLANGHYDFQLLQAWLDVTPKDNRDIVRMRLRVVNGPAPAGYILERGKLVDTQNSLNYLLGDLRTLGLDSDKWVKANGRPVSRELPLGLAKLAGVYFHAVKSEDKNGYHNLNINARLLGEPKPNPAMATQAVPTAFIRQPAAAPNGPAPSRFPPAPQQQPVGQNSPAPAQGDDDNSIPF